MFLFESINAIYLQLRDFVYCLFSIVQKLKHSVTDFRQRTCKLRR